MDNTLISSDEKPTWFTPGVAGIGTASLLSDLGHEVPTSLLPGLLTATLGAPAAALGVIEGIADAAAGGFRLVGGALADDPQRRHKTALGGYTATAVLSSLIGFAHAVWQVAVLRTGAWAARGLRVPARNALLADVVPANSYGRAYGFERAMDNLGAIGGPLLAIGLVAAFGTRNAIALSVIPGLAAALAIGYAIRRSPRRHQQTHQPIRLQVRKTLHGPMARLMTGITAFEVGNCAATLLILRATELYTPTQGIDGAARTALLLYTGYNIAATAASFPAGRLADRIGHTGVLRLGVTLFLAAYLTFALATATLPILLTAFVLAGLGIGVVETAQHSAVASTAADTIRGSAFGILAGIQSIGNLAASGITGLLWTLTTPTIAFLYLTGWMAIALIVLTLARKPTPAQ